MRPGGKTNRTRLASAPATEAEVDEPLRNRDANSAACSERSSSKTLDSFHRAHARDRNRPRFFATGFDYEQKHDHEHDWHLRFPPRTRSRSWSGSALSRSA